MKNLLIAAAVIAPALATLSTDAATPQRAGRTRDGYTLVYKDVPHGRGQTQSLPFWVRETRTDAPYALTGTRQRTERVVWKDVPHGRGQTQSLPFVVRE